MELEMYHNIKCHNYRLHTAYQAKAVMRSRLTETKEGASTNKSKPGDDGYRAYAHRT